MDDPSGPSPSPPLRNLVLDVTRWQPKIVKRPRPVKSCVECRRRKLRCDRRCPCTQCQRSFRVCNYVAARVLRRAGSSTRGTDPNNPNADSDGSRDGSDQEDDDDNNNNNGDEKAGIHDHRSASAAATAAAGGRPAQRHLPGSHPPPPQPHLPTSSSLSLLLNPPSPAVRDSVPLPAAGAAADAAPHASMSAGPPAMPSSSMLEHPEALLSLGGRDLRRATASLVLEFKARVDRLEQLILAQDASALSGLPPFPSSTTLSQLCPQQQQDRRQQVIDASSTTMRSVSVRGGQGTRTRFFGPNSTRVLLNLFADAKAFMADRTRRDGAADVFDRLERIHRALQENHLHTLKPIAVYADSMTPVQKRMADILPHRDVCDRLFEAYVNVAEGLYRVIHVPAFRQELGEFWARRRSGGWGGANAGAVAGAAAGAGAAAHRGVSKDFLPRLLCILCIGSRFETESRGLENGHADGVHIPTACALVRSWLDTLRGKHSVDINTLQTEVLHLHASRLIAPRPQRVWTELGMISRMAMAMGLHRDPAESAAAVSPFQAECRRKLWFTIMDMDLHVSLVSGLPSALRPGEFTCQPPRNLDDDDLRPDMPALPPAKPMDEYTEGQMQRVAADTLPLRMRASDLLCRIDALTDYGEVLAVGSQLETALDHINCLFPRNEALSSQQKYKEWRMRALLDMHVRRPLLALYRPFALSASPGSPPQPAALADVYLKSSMAMLTYMRELDPEIPGFGDVSHMHYIILRSDIVQAAFSVCYYIAQAVEAEGAGAGAGAGAGVAAAADVPGRASAAAAAHSTDTGSPPHARGPLIWSSAFMVRTVERTVENLARLVSDLSFDMRDVVALATVLGSVMPATSPAQRDEHIRAQLERVLGACAESLQRHASPAVRAAIAGECAELPPMYASAWSGRPQLLPEERMLPGEEEPWDTSFWDYWATAQA